MAAHKNCVEVVKGMVEVKQCEINAVDNEGRTALHHAAAQGYVGVTQALWSAKCNIELADNHGWTGISKLTAPDPQVSDAHASLKLRISHRLAC